MQPPADEAPPESSAEEQTFSEDEPRTPLSPLRRNGMSPTKLRRLSSKDGGRCIAAAAGQPAAAAGAPGRQELQTNNETTLVDAQPFAQEIGRQEAATAVAAKETHCQEAAATAEFAEETRRQEVAAAAAAAATAAAAAATAAVVAMDPPTPSGQVQMWSEEAMTEMKQMVRGWRLLTSDMLVLKESLSGLTFAQLKAGAQKLQLLPMPLPLTEEEKIQALLAPSVAFG